METLYEYIQNSVSEGATIDALSEIVGIIKDTINSSTEVINTAIRAKREIQADKKLRTNVKWKESFCIC